MGFIGFIGALIVACAAASGLVALGASSWLAGAAILAIWLGWRLED